MMQPKPNATDRRFPTFSIRGRLMLAATLCVAGLVVPLPTQAFPTVIQHIPGVRQQQVCDVGPNGVVDAAGHIDSDADDLLCDGTGPGLLRSDAWRNDPSEPYPNFGQIDASGVSLAVNERYVVQVFRLGFQVLDLETQNMERVLIRNLKSAFGYCQGTPDVAWEPNGRRWILLFNANEEQRHLGPCLLVSRSEVPSVEEGDWYYLGNVFFLPRLEFPADHVSYRLAIWPGALFLTADRVVDGTYRGSSVFAISLDDVESNVANPSQAQCIQCSSRPWLAASATRPSDAAVGQPGYLLTGRTLPVDCVFPQVCGPEDIEFGILVHRASPDLSTGSVFVSEGIFVRNRDNFAEKPPSGQDNFLLLEPLRFPRLVPQLDQLVFTGASSGYVPAILPLHLQTAAGAPRTAVFSNPSDRLAPDAWSPSLWTTREFGRDDGSVAVIWEQIDVSGATPALAQFGVHGDTLRHRWMPSLAVDKLGNMALGMSASEPLLSTADIFSFHPRFPNMAIKTRLHGQPPDTLEAPEWQPECPYETVNGLPQCASQGQGNVPNALEGGDGRWGGNSAMAVDASGCALFYSNQLITAQASPFTLGTAPEHWTQWRTRIARFELDPLCREVAAPSLTQVDHDAFYERSPAPLQLTAVDEAGGSGLMGPPYCVLDGQPVSMQALVAGQDGGTYEILVPGNTWIECSAADRAENETTSVFRVRTDAAPQVESFSVSVVEDGFVNFSLAAHAEDDVTPDGGLVFNQLTDPSQGGLFFVSTGHVTYTPFPDVFGADSIAFEACDALDQCAAGKVSISITPVDDPPLAVDDTGTFDEDAVLTEIFVLANDIDVDAGPKTIVSVTQPAHGQVLFTTLGLGYEPDPDYCNEGGPTDDFSYTLSPGGSSATVAVTVRCINDAPTLTLDGPGAANEGDTLSYAFTVSDPDAGDSFGVLATSCGAGGVLSNPSFASTSGAGGFDCRFPDGPASPVVAARVTDAAGAPSNEGTVAVTVANVAPTPQIDSVAGGLPFVPVGAAFELHASFGDPGSDSFAAALDWEGDGVFEDDLGPVVRNGFSASHSFPEPGLYTIVVEVSDEDGDAGTASATLEVLAPDSGLQSVADQLTALLGTDPLDDPVLQAAIDALVGNDGGVADNGALDKLGSGELASALGKLEDAELALGNAAGSDVTDLQLLIAQIARVLAEQAIADAREATGCTLPLTGTCSKGERKAFERLEGYLAQGIEALESGAWADAVAGFKEATQRAEAYLPAP
jgi:hypothetical protein